MPEAGRFGFEPRSHQRGVPLKRDGLFSEHFEEAFAAEYNFSPVGQVTLDRNGCICRLNVAAANLLKGNESQLLDVPFLAFVEKSYCRTFLDHLSACLRFRKRVFTEIVLASYTRCRNPVELHSVPGVDQSREGIVCRTAIIEKSARDSAPRGLSEGRQDYVELAKDLSAQIVANNSIATAIISLKTGRCLSANKMFCTLAGVHHREIVGQSLSEIGWRLVASDQSDLIKKFGPQSSIQNCEARIRRPDGGGVDDVLASAKTILFGNEQCILLMIQDLTDVQRLKQDVAAISEEEQRRFGRDLHDSHCQDLTAISFFAETIAATLDTKDPDCASQVRALGEMVRKSAESVHMLAASLSSQQIEQSGLVKALEELASHTSQRFSVACTVKADRKHTIRDTLLAVHLYRIAQEAMSNAARHSHAKKIEVSMRREGDRDVLEIADDGVGFSVEGKAAGLGLRTMDYRASVIRGTLKIVSKPGSGTVVTCSFPTPATK
jgi:PAS domain S-box-containing protein